MSKFSLLLIFCAFMWGQPANAFNNNFSVFEALYLGQKNSGFVRISEDRGAMAQKLVSNMGEEAIGFLGDDSLSASQKSKAFRKLLDNSFDMDIISRFALGRNWKVATSAQKKEYQSLVEDMIVDVYSQRFSEYKGEGFEVQSVRPTGKKDYLVSSLILPDNGQKVKVDWRVRDYGGNKMKIIDVVIEGVSMTLTQRSEFASVIQRGGGNIEALLEHLRK